MMDATSGRALDEMAHIRQSIRDILTTRIGSRVMRREYGSLVPALIDQPGNAATLLRLRAATVMAVLRWETRIQPTRVGFDLSADGRATVTLEAVRRGGPRTRQTLSLAVQV